MVVSLAMNPQHLKKSSQDPIFRTAYIYSLTSMKRKINDDFLSFNRECTFKENISMRFFDVTLRVDEECFEGISRVNVILGNIRNIPHDHNAR